MGMSSYIMDIEENFWNIVTEFIKEAEHWTEASEKAVILARNMAPFLDVTDVEEGVSEMWNEYWSEYSV
jgi:hypothetical protein